MDIPFLVLGSPAPHTVLRPCTHTHTHVNIVLSTKYTNYAIMLTSTKSVSFSGKSYGFQRNYIISRNIKCIHTHTHKSKMFLWHRNIYWLGHLVWIRGPVVEVISEIACWYRREGSVNDRGTDAIEPGPLIGLPGSRERCP